MTSSTRATGKRPPTKIARWDPLRLRLRVSWTRTYTECTPYQRENGTSAAARTHRSLHSTTSLQSASPWCPDHHHHRAIHRLHPHLLVHLLRHRCRLLHLRARLLRLLRPIALHPCGQQANQWFLPCRPLRHSLLPTSLLSPHPSHLLRAHPFRSRHRRLLLPCPARLRLT